MPVQKGGASRSSPFCRCVWVNVVVRGPLTLVQIPEVKLRLAGLCDDTFYSMVSAVQRRSSYQTTLLALCHIRDMVDLCLEINSSPGHILIFLFIFKTLCVWVFCLHERLCTTCVSGTHQSQQSLDPLTLELSKVANCDVGARDHTWVLRKDNQCSQ